MPYHRDFTNLRGGNFTLDGDVVGVNDDGSCCGRKPFADAGILPLEEPNPRRGLVETPARRHSNEVVAVISGLRAVITTCSCILVLRRRRVDGRSSD